MILFELKAAGKKTKFQFIKQLKTVFIVEPRSRRLTKTLKNSEKFYTHAKHMHAHKRNVSKSWHYLSVLWYICIQTVHIKQMQSSTMLMLYKFVCICVCHEGFHCIVFWVFYKCQYELSLLFALSKESIHDTHESSGVQRF